MKSESDIPLEQELIELDIRQADLLIKDETYYQAARGGQDQRDEFCSE